MSRFRDLAPEVHDSTGDRFSGTSLDKEFFEELFDAIEGALYSETLPISSTPVSSQEEVAAARGVYPTLTAKLAALEELAAGTTPPESQVSGGTNLLINDSFLMWPEGTTGLPAKWERDTESMTLVRVADGNGIAGRGYVRLTVPSGTHQFYQTLLSASEIGTLASMGFLAGRDFAVGAYIKSADPGVASVYIDDGYGIDEVGEQSTTGAWEWIHGGKEMGSTPTLLRMGVQVVGPTTVDIGAGLAMFASDAPVFLPSPSRKGVFVVGAGPEGEIAAGVKSKFRPPTYIYVQDCCLIAIDVAPSTGNVTAMVYKGASAMMSSLILESGNSIGVRTQPSNITLACLDSEDALKFSILTCPAEVRGISCEIRYIEYPSSLQALIGGGSIL